MKKLFYILAAACVVSMSMTSCSDLLEEDNFGNPSVEDMMGDPDGAVMVIGQAYADLKWIHDHWGYWGVNTLTSDEAACPPRNEGTDWDDAGYWASINIHTWDSFGKAFLNIWDTTIAGAVRCNQILHTMPNYKESIGANYDAFVGELEVLRSYYFYLLFDCFGRIPYVESFDKEYTDPLMDVADVWSHLVACLERNAPNMKAVSGSDRASYYGRVTQGFAYGLLSRLYLNAESYADDGQEAKFAEKVFSDKYFIRSEAEREGENDKRQLVPARWLKNEGNFYTCCVECCDAVIGAASYRIEDSYFDNFAINNEESEENIFVTVDDGNDTFDHRGWGDMSSKFRLLAMTLHYNHQQTWGLVEKPWCGFSARPTFMELYKSDKSGESADVRGPGNELFTNKTIIRTVTDTTHVKANNKEWIVYTYEESAEPKLGVETQLCIDTIYRTENGKQVIDKLIYESVEIAEGTPAGTESKQRWGWFVGPVLDKEGRLTSYAEKNPEYDKDEAEELGDKYTVPEAIAVNTIITTDMRDIKHDASYNDGARMWKYEIEKTGKNRWADNDFVIMRYAEILWNKEEALKRGGAGASGVGTPDFQTLMARSFEHTNNGNADVNTRVAKFKEAYGDPATWSDKDFLDERGREFFWELLRRRDLIRFDEYKNVEFVEDKGSYRNWFPIPYAVIERSLRDPKTGKPIWTQNPGYTDPWADK